METNYKYLNEGFEESPANKDINSFSKIYRIGKSRWSKV
jgi:hypothetical protein